MSCAKRQLAECSPWLVFLLLTAYVTKHTTKMVLDDRQLSNFLDKLLENHPW